MQFSIGHDNIVIIGGCGGSSSVSNFYSRVIEADSLRFPLSS